MRRSISRLSAFAVCALIALPALAQTEPAATPPAAPAAAGPGASWLEGPIAPEIGKLVDVKTLPALQNIVKAGTEIRFLGDEYGVKAYFMTNNGQGQVVYITPDNQAVLVGTLFSGDGNAITFMQLLRLRRTGFDPTPFFAGGTPGATQPGATTTAQAAATTESPGERLLRETGNASWIAFGPATAPQITAFMDPNCDHCHNFFREMLPLTQQGKLYLRVIPISLVDPTKSRQDVHNILSATNPAAAWTAAVNGEAVAPVTSPSDKVILALSSNNDLFTNWKLNVTPYSVYRNKAGEVKVLAAEPTDFKAFLADLGVNP